MDVGGYGVRKGMCLQVSKHSLLFLVTTLIRTRNAPSAYHFGNCKALQNSVSETRAETNIYIFLTIYTCPAFCPQTMLLRLKQKNPCCLLLGKL